MYFHYTVIVMYISKISSPFRHISEFNPAKETITDDHLSFYLHANQIEENTKEENS